MIFRQFMNKIKTSQQDPCFGRVGYQMRQPEDFHRCYPQIKVHHQLVTGHTFDNNYESLVSLRIDFLL